MRKALPWVLVFAVAVAWASDVRWGWARGGSGGPSGGNSPAAHAAEVRTIAIHLPDPAKPGEMRYHVLRVFSVATDRGVLEVSEPKGGNWIVSTYPGDAPAGKGGVTYHASPAE